MEAENEHISARTLTGSVHERLRGLIYAGELPPGSRLVIQKLADRFGVSATPVREALRWLQRDGLATGSAYHSWVVTKADNARLVEMFEIRGILEGYAMRQVVSTITDDDIVHAADLCDALEHAAAQGDGAEFRKVNLEFHEYLLGRATSSVLKAMIGNLVSDLERYRPLSLKITKAYLERAQKQHRQILDMVRNRHVQGIESLVRDHAMLFVTHLLSPEEESAE